ncbi:MAG: ribosome biogenesis GTP-binding protein YihA/YsxC [Gammaproteobacteria bacterium]|nr:ribosome biogenesis GTP-binding protein YihA/YsxC [Gammaproteobacteria bacterium]
MAELRHPALRRAFFTMAANAISQLPADNGLEVGFAGRSNAGKSSAVNTITGQNSLARTSKTPGRTQQIIFFSLDEQRRLVDLPGYGFAKVPFEVKDHWRNLMEGYFRQRASLKGLVLVMDVRHAMRDYDQIMLDWCEATKTPVHVLLTKSDKLSRGAASNELQKVRKELQKWKVDHEVQLFSSLNAVGLEPVLAKLCTWLDLPPLETT